MNKLEALAEEISRIRQNVEFKIDADDLEALEKVEAWLCALAPGHVPFIPGDHKANVLAVIEAYNAALDNDDQPGGSISPIGDDFNEVLGMIEAVLNGHSVPAIRLSHDGR
jgi:hypothetical protein